MDAATGKVLWTVDYQAPVVAMYSLDTEGMRKLPFTSVAADMLSHLTGQMSSTYWRDRFMDISSEQQDFL